MCIQQNNQFHQKSSSKKRQVLESITEFIKKDFTWSKEQQNAFEKNKITAGKLILLTYPNFNKSFIIHTVSMDGIETKEQKDGRLCHQPFLTHLFSQFLK